MVFATAENTASCCIPSSRIPVLVTLISISLVVQLRTELPPRRLKRKSMVERLCAAPL
uniref:Uncharacterized protein n=1 Tax=Physcomitrium patens TaxID=3218 RepID=A0A2K1JKP3_PHYPA|nr:hypothetical protein PHYPA_016952 [Physcomitrium patens]